MILRFIDDFEIYRLGEILRFDFEILRDFEIYRF